MKYCLFHLNSHDDTNPIQDISIELKILHDIHMYFIEIRYLILEIFKNLFSESYYYRKITKAVKPERIFPLQLNLTKKKKQDISPLRNSPYEIYHQLLSSFFFIR